MPVDKFESLVETGRLFFPSVALLAEEMDPFEGRLSAPTIGEFRKIPAGEAADKVAERQAIADHNLGLIHASRQLLYVSGIASHLEGAPQQVRPGGLVCPCGSATERPYAVTSASKQGTSRSRSRRREPIHLRRAVE